MLPNIKQFFQQHMTAPGSRSGTGQPQALQVATAALLVEVMRADQHIKEAERHAVTHTLQKCFGLAPAETAELIRLAEREATQATDYYQFTTLINEHFTAEQKQQVVEYLWQVAAADHEIERFERTLVQKIADLLHVPRAAQIAARDRALASPRND